MTTRRPYRTDLTDEQWVLIEPVLTKWRADRRSIRPPVHGLREIVNAIFYVNRTGVPWDLLPHDFPPAKTVYDYYAKWSKDGTDQAIHDLLRTKTRQHHGRADEPTAAMLDSQSAKSAFSTDADTVGIDGNKKVRGRKRSIVTDTLGLLLLVLVTAANVHDVHPGRHLVDMVADRHPTISKMWGDTAYRGAVDHAATKNIDLEITTKGLGVKGFQPLWHCWKIERTLGWFGRSRRLARDYETTPRSQESQIYWTMAGIMLRRVTNTSPVTTYRTTPETPLPASI
ncbi:IS5 family transposase (plasmid) [Streptomyces sp. NBC_00289]|uniref:IS5 family transposase n=1 Tax=Streptomyces sp. NBC_00289 TaxID=2975703 RepID=UPI002F914F9E